MSEDDDPLVIGRLSRRLPRRSLREFAECLRARVARGRNFACLLAGDAELRRLNRDFRGQDHATDVLSFPAVDGSDTLGDIAISVDRAAEQARERGHAIADEIRVLMLHGLLHLLGYDHEGDAGRMARAERRWRRELGLPAGLIERVRS